MHTTPEAVTAALNHVREHFPQVCQVFFSVNSFWLYCDENFNAPIFEGDIDVSILEDAAAAVTSFPASYAI